MTYKNAPRLKPTPSFGSNAKALGGDDIPVMQDDCVHWNGQPIAVVLADSQEQADHATTAHPRALRRCRGSDDAGGSQGGGAEARRVHGRAA